MRRAILLLALILLACNPLSPRGTASGGTENFVRSVDATAWTYLDESDTGAINDGVTPIRLNIADGYHRWPMIRFVVPSLNVGETFDSARVVAFGVTGGKSGVPLLFVQRILRTTNYTQATYNSYATGSAWTAAGAWGVGDCDFDTDYGYGTNGHCFEFYPPPNVVQDSVLIARGTGFNVLATSWIVGKTCDLIWHSLDSDGSMGWPYGTDAETVLRVYGHRASATYESTRRRRMMDGE
jgi:hypothetical protein